MENSYANTGDESVKPGEDAAPALDVIILDEPTLHLDAESAEQILSLVSKLDWRPAVLLISHDTRVLRFASRVVRIEDGVLVDTHRRQAVGV